MAKNPFRPCDHCGKQRETSRTSHNPADRAWTLYPHSRKLACPSCTAEGRAEDEQVRRLLMRFGSLLSHRLTAEPMALYGREHAGAWPDSMLVEQVGALRLLQVLEDLKRMKIKHPDVLLLYRIGDGLHTFKSDALVLFRHTDLSMELLLDGAGTLQHVWFPVDELERYLPGLVKAGLRVGVVGERARAVGALGDEGVGLRGSSAAYHLLLRQKVEPKGAPDPSGRAGHAQAERTSGPAFRRADQGKPRATACIGSLGALAFGGARVDDVVAEPVEQYRRLKPQFKHSLLVLRDHSGYLMLYRDAEKAATILGVGYSGNGAFRIAGALLEQVLDKLVRAGHRVAVVIDPQVDDPRLAKQTDLWDALLPEEDSSTVAIAVG